MYKALNRSEIEAIRNYYHNLFANRDDSDTSKVDVPEDKIVEVPVILGI